MKTDKIGGIPVQPSEITPEAVYLKRRDFMKLAGTAAAAALLASCGIGSKEKPASTQPVSTESASTQPASTAAATARPTQALPEALQSGKPSKDTDELGDKLTSYNDITNYNNYYEFSTDKQSVARQSKNFQSNPWTVEVGGMVQNPKTYALEDLLTRFEQKERIYRLRCVEAWSMVIPWVGFELGDLLKEVQPKIGANYVGFTTLLDTSRFPMQRDPMYPWPYTEGLRIDEAMNHLAILATGMYGKPLPPQDGAPIRLVVPWKYGFKSIKAVVKIELLSEQPKTLWSSIAPDEYGFYANVNPNVNHPRWSQATERRIGETARRKTLMFNGYQDEVASLYTGMDLAANY